VEGKKSYRERKGNAAYDTRRGDTNPNFAFKEGGNITKPATKWGRAIGRLSPLGERGRWFRRKVNNPTPPKEAYDEWSFKTRT